MNNNIENKIVNAIKYFVKNTKKIGLTKLFKLLYFFDFSYFKEHGLKVTLLDYYTYDFGPVPKELYNSITNDDLPEYFKNEILFRKQIDNDEFKNPRYEIIIKNKKIDLSCFVPYEQKKLEEIAFVFKEVDANEISEISHLKNQPWELTKRTKGMYQMIDFELAIDEESTLDLEEIRELINLQQELKLNGRI